MLWEKDTNDLKMDEDMKEEHGKHEDPYGGVRIKLSSLGDIMD